MYQRISISKNNEDIYFNGVTSTQDRSQGHYFTGFNDNKAMNIKNSNFNQTCVTKCFSPNNTEYLVIYL